jgi:hypothetical protein
LPEESRSATAEAANGAARAVTFASAWLLLIGVAALGPSGDGQDGQRVWDWLRFRGDPSLVAVFNYLGVWPMLYASVLLADPPAPEGSRVPSWPFVAGGFFAGAFALLPYLALRRWSTCATDRSNRAVRWVTSRGVATVLLVVSAGLIAWGLLAGDPQAYIRAWRSSSLVFTMTADFAVLTIAWWPLLWDDARRRQGPRWAAALGALPLLGAPLWLLARNR